MKGILSSEAMTEPFVDAEVDRTKSKWVAKAYREFGKSKTTLRALFYFAMQRKESDYPICGGFVGEIRCTRPYHESDGEKLPKWAGKASRMGFIPADAILEEVPGEHVFLPAVSAAKPATKPAIEPETCQVELWLNKSALNQLLEPVCRRYGAALVSVGGRPSKEAIVNLFARSRGHTTIILCLSDLSPGNFSFCEELRLMIDEDEDKGKDKGKGSIDGNVQVKRIGLTPEQVLELEIPMVPAKKGSREDQKKYKSYLKPYGLSDKRMAELDALEVYYPGGIAGFVEEAISKTFASTSTALPA
ncbi:MAG TPA: hypothetical protein VLB04_12550 [Methanotrichaceae archaeon]|nr:hypothetical protein [Methanotrichaceae archaeon]